MTRSLYVLVMWLDAKAMPYYDYMYAFYVFVMCVLVTTLAPPVCEDDENPISTDKFIFAVNGPSGSTFQAEAISAITPQVCN